MRKNYLRESLPSNPEILKDEEILRASLDEPAIFEILVQRYQEPLLRAAMRVVRGREEAEDIVQEAFVKMYKNADRFHKSSFARCLKTSNGNFVTS